MTFWEILDNLADLCYVTVILIVLLSVASLVIYSIVTKKSIHEAMAEFEDDSEDEYIKRLDNLQRSVDILVYKSLHCATDLDSIKHKNDIENSEQKNDEK